MGSTRVVRGGRRRKRRRTRVYTPKSKIVSLPRSNKRRLLPEKATPFKLDLPRRPAGRRLRAAYRRTTVGDLGPAPHTGVGGFIINPSVRVWSKPEGTPSFSTVSADSGGGPSRPAITDTGGGPAPSGGSGGGKLSKADKKAIRQAAYKAAQDAVGAKEAAGWGTTLGSYVPGYDTLSSGYGAVAPYLPDMGDVVDVWSKQARSQGNHAAANGLQLMKAAGKQPGDIVKYAAEEFLKGGTGWDNIVEYGPAATSAALAYLWSELGSRFRGSRNRDTTRYLMNLHNEL